MKKFFVFLLALVLFVPSAFAGTDKEIVFHGIPWGISVNELVDSLQQRDISVSSSDIESNASMEIWTRKFQSDFGEKVDSTGYRIWLYYLELEDQQSVKIAGYPVFSIELYAHYGISSGKISFDAESSNYYFATIHFASDDKLSMGLHGDERTVQQYSDLCNKLSSLYGKGEEYTVTLSGTIYTYTIWNGANNSAVCLSHSDTTSSLTGYNYQELDLMYGKTDCEQTLREVRRLVIEHEVQSVADDSTGL